MLDKATILTTIFTIVDDTMKGSAVMRASLEAAWTSPTSLGQRADHHRPLSGTHR